MDIQHQKCFFRDKHLLLLIIIIDFSNWYLMFLKTIDVHVPTRVLSHKWHEYDHQGSRFWTDDDVLSRYQLPARRDTRSYVIAPGRVNDPRSSPSYRGF